ncbi:MAG TPA: hypothetical protein VI039_01740 [Solirubrobacterales bacterium]
MAGPVNELEPIFTERIDFAFADLFQADDPLTPWLINLARATDDVLLANRRLARNLAGSDSEVPSPRNHEVIYDIKAVASHAWELAKFIRLKSSGAPAIAEFVEKRMPAKSREDLDEALLAFESADGDSQNEKAFKGLLASARNQASHYSKVDHSLMSPAVQRLETDLEGRTNETSLLLGRTFKDFYAPFATEMDWQLFHALDGGSLKAFKGFNTKLNEVVGRLIRFSTTAIHCYFRDREAETRTVELEPVKNRRQPGEGAK